MSNPKSRPSSRILQRLCLCLSSVAVAGLSLALLFVTLDPPAASAAQPAAPASAPAAGSVLTPTFTNEYFGPLKNAPLNFALADLNGDGALDLVQRSGCYTEAGQPVCLPGMIYLNDGHGNYPDTETFGVAEQTSGGKALAVGDVNGDGAVDIVAGDGVLYLNDGLGHFGITQTLPIPWLGDLIFLGDVDGNGTLDLVTQSSVVYLNDGTGLFPISRTVISGESVQALGDVNEDGALDIIAMGYVSQDSWRMRVYLNDGAGQWDLGQTLPATWLGTTRLGDLNGDGSLDVVQNSGSSLWLYFNEGAGHFSPPQYVSPAEYNGSGLVLGDINSDGALDILVPGYNSCYWWCNSYAGYLYVNDGHGGFGAGITLGDATGNQVITVGDINGDGASEIIQGHGCWSNLFGDLCRPNTVYVYADEAAGFYAAAPFGDAYDTIVVAVGDLNGDGALDLVQGNGSIVQSVLYFTDGAAHFDAGLRFGREAWTYDLALGDLNGDGVIDLVQSSGCQWSYDYNCAPSFVYLSDGTGAFPISHTLSATNLPTGLALGDVNGDGALDIVQGNHCTWDYICQPSMVYLNLGDGTFDPGTPFSEALNTWGVAVGDINGDGALDIVQSNSDTPSRVYLNDGAGHFDAGTQFGEVYNARDVALGDLNGDGALDIVLANDGQASVVFFNDGAGHFSLATPFGRANGTWSVTLGDLNEDGALDVVQANTTALSTIFLNDGTGHFGAGADFGQIGALRPALGDVNGDGNLDIVEGLAGPARSAVYLNTRQPGPRLPNTPPTVRLAMPPLLNANFAYTDSAQRTAIIPISYTISDPDGDLVGTVVASYSPDGGGRWYTPVAAAGTVTTQRVPRRTFGAAYITPTLAIPDNDLITSSVALTASAPLTLTDVNVWVAISHTDASQLQLVLQSPGGLTVTLLATGTLSGPISQTLAFDDDALNPIISAAPPYSGTYRPLSPLLRFNGQDAYGEWTLLVQDGVISETGDLRGWGLQVQNDAGTYVYNWDVFGSGFFGSSDNMVFRLAAYPGPLTTTLAMTGTYRYTTTVPVFQHPYASTTSSPFRVRGTQVRVISDTIPVSNAMVYQLPSGQTAGAQPIQDLAGQAFHTDGQGYLQGRGRIDPGDQLMAMVPLTSTDSYTLFSTSAKPNQTGIDLYTVTAGGVQTLTVSTANPLALFNLDLSLKWDARNDRQYLQTLQTDLKRASEVLYDLSNGQAALGQVRVFFNREHWNDAHIRLYANNRLRPFAALGGLVSTPITDPLKSNLIYDPGQVSLAATWNRYGNPGQITGEDWARTLAHELSHYLFFLDDNYLGLNLQGLLIPVTSCSGSFMSDPYRDDYSEFHPADSAWTNDCSRTLSHQSTGRPDWQTVTTFYPALGAHAPGTPNPGPSSLPLAVTRISFVGLDTPTTALPDPRFYLTYAGASLRPGRCARAFLFTEGDSAVVDLGTPVLDQVLARGAKPGDRVCVFEPDAGRQGCKTILDNDNQQLSLTAISGWQPDLLISPVTSRTVNVQVGNLPVDLTLWAQLYPTDGFIAGAEARTLTWSGQSYTGTFTLAESALDGYVRVWVGGETPARELITDFSVGGNPADRRSGYADRRSGYADRRSGYAPVLSGDGQVFLYLPDATVLPVGTLYTLQAATYLPEVPSWMTVVGKGYHLAQSAGAPPLAGASLNLGYARSDVPAGSESWLKVYRYDADTGQWQALPTQLDTETNSATAGVPGPGLYVLMTTIEIPLYGPGWTLFAYPIVGARSIAEALLPISGTYSIVYGYVPTETVPFNRWQVYPPQAPDYVRTLHTLEFGHGYWINITDTQRVTLTLRPADVINVGGLEPPTTYYGAVQAGEGFTPTEGMEVTAWVKGNFCGQGQTLTDQGQLVYTVQVLADHPAESPGCGTDGVWVTFKIGETTMATARWDNTQAWEVALAPTGNIRLYLPLVRR